MEESGREEEEKNTEKEDSENNEVEAEISFPSEKSPLQIEEELPVSLAFW